MRKPILVAGALIVGVLFGVPVAPAQQADEARNEWRQPNADAAHSRYVSGDIRPPLSVAWESPQLPILRSMVAAGDRILALCRRGWYLQERLELLCIDANTGKVTWRKSFGTPDPNRGVPHMGPTLVATSSNVFVGAWDGLYVYRISDGKLIRDRIPFGADAEGLRPLIVTRADEVIALEGRDSLQPYTVPSWHRAFRGSDGAQLWARKLDFGHWTVHRDFYRKKVYMLQYAGAGQMPGPSGWLFVRGNHEVITLEPDTRRARGLRYMSAGRWGPVAAGADGMYVLRRPWPRRPGGKTTNLKLLALDQRAFQKWSCSFPNTKSIDLDDFGPPVVTPKSVLLWDGRRLWAVDRHKRRIAWVTRAVPRMRQGSFAGPVGAGSVLYAVGTVRRAGTRQDRLLAYDLKSGRLIWSYTPTRSATVWSVIAHRNALYLWLVDDGYRMAAGGAEQEGKAVQRLVKLVPARR